MPTPIRIVAFDLGGVMIHLAGGWTAACDAAGVRYRPFPVTLDMEEVLGTLEEQFSTNTISAKEYYAHVRELTGSLYTDDEIAAIYQATIRDEIVGIFDLVQGIRHTGVLTACLSNTCAPHWEDLTNPARYPAISALDFRYASHLFGVAKPDVRIYRMFESATGLAPADIVFFDDREENVAAALDCGWHAHRVTDPASAVEQMRGYLSMYGLMISC